MKRFIAIVLMLILAFPFFVACGDDVVTTDGDSSSASKESGSANTNTSIDTSKKYYADIVIKEYGKITLELDAKTAPITVENFVNLSNSGFYNGLTFHRIMEGFMMQGGDPEGNGTGGSENNIIGEFIANGHNNTISHKRGVISMARQGNPYNDAPYFNTASSQFFIMHEDAPSLDGSYAAFGWVIEGMDVVDNVCESANPIDGNGTIPADEQPVIESITIRVE